MHDIASRLARHRVVPVLTLDDPRDAAALAGALVEGGLPVAEVTLRTPGAVDALSRMREAHPDLLLGAGTVLSPEQADGAIAAGAEFIVSPGLNPRVVDHCLGRGVPVFPGVCTPTEIETAMERGLRVLKFFPAEPAGGVRFLRAVCAPYGEVRFLPTGGISASNLSEYLALSQVVACGGSWMATPQMIRDRQFPRIRAEVESVVRAVHTTQGA